MLPNSTDNRLFVIGVYLLIYPSVFNFFEFYNLNHHTWFIYPIDIEDMDGRDILDDYRFTNPGIQNWHNTYFPPAGLQVAIDGIDIALSVTKEKNFP
jgi:hypothetical protein